MVIRASILSGGRSGRKCALALRTIDAILADKIPAELGMRCTAFSSHKTVEMHIIKSFKFEENNCPNY